MKRSNLLIAFLCLGIGYVFGHLNVNFENVVRAQSGERSSVAVDDTNVVPVYANFCRVTGTPEELILDYALNAQPMGVPTKPIPTSQRIVLNYYTAKRMLRALEMSIQRHEAAFGELEIDVQKRVKTEHPPHKP